MSLYAGEPSKHAFASCVAGSAMLRGTIHVPRMKDMVIPPETQEPNSDPLPAAEEPGADTVDDSLLSDQVAPVEEDESEEADLDE